MDKAAIWAKKVIEAKGWYSKARLALDNALVQAYEQGWDEAVEACCKNLHEGCGLKSSDAEWCEQELRRLRIEIEA